MSSEENLKGQIDLTRLGEIVRQHPQVVTDYTDREGNTHKMLNVDILKRKEVSGRGATHYMKVNLYHKTPVSGLNYYIADLSPINFSKGGGNPSQSVGGGVGGARNGNDEYPF